MKEMYDSTILENLFISLNREVAKKCSLYMPSIKPSPNSANYTSLRKPHEAGYDAFMCGTVFLKLAHTLAHLDTKSCYNSRANNMNDYFLIMKPFESKIKLVKSSIDFVNFTGQDPRPINKTLFVKSKYSNLSIFELIKAFSSFGPVEVVQQSSNTALVVVDSELNAAYILQALKANEKYEVSFYNFWRHSPYINHIFGIGAGLSLLVALYSIKKFCKS